MERITLKEYNPEDNFSLKIALLYMIANGLSAAMSTTLSPITYSLIKYYSISEWQIFFINSSYVICFMVMNFSANYAIDNYGVKFSIKLSIILTILGAWIRITKSTTILLFGQTLMAIAGPFVTNCLSKVSNIWFSPRNRVKMTSIMSSSYMYGLGTGFLITSIIWQESADKTADTNNLSNLLLFCAMFSLVISIPVLIYFKEKPENAPSKTAGETREGFLEGIFILKNKNYLFLFIAFSLALGNFISLILMIYSILSPFGYTENQISNLGLIINFSSGTSKIIVAYVAVTYLSVKKTILLDFICLIVSILLFLIAISTKIMFFVYLSSAILGFFVQMYWGLCLELACDIVYPVSESHANGYLLFGGCGCGLISNFIVSFFVDNNHPFAFFVFLIFSYLVCIYCVYQIDDTSKREEGDVISMSNLLINS